MAMPDAATIRQHFLDGKWDENMLKTARVCKAITAEQVDEFIAEKKAMEAAATKKKSK